MMKKALLVFMSVVLLMLSMVTFVSAADAISTTSSATVLENKIVIHTEFSTALDGEYMVALYDKDGRMVKFSAELSLEGVSSAEIKIDNVATAVTAKMFVMKDRTSWQPVCEAETININRQTERIVRTVQKEYVNSEYVNCYELFNQYTGEIESLYGSVSSADLSALGDGYTSGDIVTVISGKVNENEEIRYGNLSSVTASAPSTENYGLFWVVGYDAENSTIDVVRYDTGAASTGWDTAITEADISYAEFDENEIYKISIENAPITCLKNTGTFKYNAAMTVASANILNGSNKDYFAYNDTYISIADADYQTVYGNYPKVYLNIDAANGGNLTASNVDSDTGMHGEAGYVVIIVNSKEPKEYCDVKDILN